jgi:hypothetical protein
LTQRVVQDARRPLRELYSKIVDLGFDGEDLSPAALRELLAQMAAATSRLSRLLESLGDDPGLLTSTRRP